MSVMKKQRQKKLIEIIENNIIDTQDELQERLKSEGFDVTQATISRDINELRIVKMRDSNGIYKYFINHDNSGEPIKIAYYDIFSQAVVSVDYAMNNIVVKCHSGMASGACAAFDNMYGNMTLGTLAGDDTFLVITRNEQDAEHITKLLKEIVGI